MPMGPVEIIVISFDDPDFHGEVKLELDRLRENDTLRLVDLVAVRRGEHGVIESLHRSDLGEDEALAFGAAVGALIGLGAAGEDGVEVGAVWGLRELADGHVFGEDTKFRIAEVIPEGAGAIVALIEHRWAIPVRDAIRRAGGRGVAARWISEADLIELGRLVGPGLLDPSPS